MNSKQWKLVHADGFVPPCELPFTIPNEHLGRPAQTGTFTSSSRSKFTLS